MHIRQSTKARALGLGVLLGLLGAGPQLHAAEPPAAGDEPRVELLVDTERLPAALGERLHGELEDRLLERLRDEGVKVVTGGAIRTLEVRVELLDAGLRTYAISVTHLAAGEREVLADKVRCEACSEAVLVERAVALLPEALTAALEPKPAEPPPPPPPTACEVEPEIRVEPARRLKLGGVGLGGAVGVSMGLAAVGAGLILADFTAEVGAVEAVDLTGAPRTAGFAISFAGAGVSVVGAVMVAIDATLLERRRNERALSMSAKVLPRGGGVSISGRF